MRIDLIRLLFLSIVGTALISCNNIDESAFFRFDVSELAEKPAEEMDGLKLVGDLGANLRRIAIKDSLLFSLDTHATSFLALTNINNSELEGVYCPKGRSWAEPISMLPLQEFYSEGGDVKSYLFSYVDAKLFEWNISESLAQGKTIYDTIVQIDHGKKGYWPIGSYYRLDGRKIIVLDTNQIPRENTMVDVPRYEIFDLVSGQCIVRYDLFNHVELESKFPEFSNKEFLGMVDCLKPDRKKLVFAMAYFPRINILDLESGEVRGFRLKDAPRFNPSKKVWCFSSIQADDQYIYALYYGKEVDNSNYDAAPNLLYVFDWEGELVRKFKLDRHVTDLWLDRELRKLYLYHRARNDLFVYML